MKKWRDAAGVAVGAVQVPIPAERAKAIKAILDEFVVSEDGQDALALLTNRRCAVVFARDFALDGAGTFWTVCAAGDRFFSLDLKAKDITAFDGLFADSQEVGLVLAESGRSAEEILDQLRDNINKIADEVLCSAGSGSPSLPKQTYPAVGCVVTVSGQKFTFAERMGYGLVLLQGWSQLVAFNCPVGSHECEGHAVPVSDRDLRAIEKAGVYHGVLPVYRPLS